MAENISQFNKGTHSGKASWAICLPDLGLGGAPILVVTRHALVRADTRLRVGKGGGVRYMIMQMQLGTSIPLESQASLTG